VKWQRVDRTVLMNAGAGSVGSRRGGEARVFVVTGPTGNVGAELTRLLVERPGAPAYRIAAHRPEGIRARRDGVPVVRLDYDDRSTWPAVLDGIETLFLLFPLPNPRGVGTRMRPFADAAVAAGCRHVVYVSVPGADRLPFLPHYQVERHLERSGAAPTFLRCSYFAQNLLRRISTHGVDIAERGEVFIPAGNGRTSFLDARDVAEVALLAVQQPDQYRDTAHVLTGPESLTFDQAATVLSEVLERPIRYARPSMFQFWDRLRHRGVTWDTLAFMTAVYTLTRTGRNEPVTGELPGLLGRPARTFRDFARDHRERWVTRNWT